MIDIEKVPLRLLSPSDKGSYELDEDVGHITVEAARSGRSRLSTKLGFALLISVAINLGLLALLMHHNVSPGSSNLQLSDMDKIRAISTYSPILDHVKFRLERVEPNIQFWDNFTDIFRRDPSPEVDAAWASITQSGQLILSREELLRLGKPVETAQQNPLDPSGETYVGHLLAMHNLHCLDYLRRAAYPDYYESVAMNLAIDHDADSRSPVPHENPQWWPHFRHCVEVLRQELMCNANTEVFHTTWTDHFDGPQFDFSPVRVCRNFDALLEFRDKFTVDLETAKKIHGAKKPAGSEERRLPREAVKEAALQTLWHRRIRAKFGLLRPDEITAGLGSEERKILEEDNVI